MPDLNTELAGRAHRSTREFIAGVLEGKRSGKPADFDDPDTLRELLAGYVPGDDRLGGPEENLQRRMLEQRLAAVEGREWQPKDDTPTLAASKRALRESIKQAVAEIPR